MVCGYRNSNIKNTFSSYDNVTVHSNGNFILYTISKNTYGQFQMFDCSTYLKMPLSKDFLHEMTMKINIKTKKQKWGWFKVSKSSQMVANKQVGSCSKWLSGSEIAWPKWPDNSLV